MGNVILIVLTFIVNFILNYYFWIIVVGVAPLWGHQADPNADASLVIQLTLASVLIPGIIASSGLLTPIFARTTSNARRASGQEKVIMEESLDDICQRANLNPKDYPLYVSHQDVYNAFALGKTITFFYPMLRDFPQDEITAIMAHEMGHIRHGHTKTLLFCTGMDWFTNVIAFVFNTVSFFCRLLVFIPFLGWVLNIFVFFVTLIYNMLNMLTYLPSFLISRFGSRQNEYQADAYAAELGYGPALASSLMRLEEATGNQKMNIFQKIACDHPDTEARVKAIRKIVEKQQQESGFWDD